MLLLSGAGSIWQPASGYLVPVGAPIGLADQPAGDDAISF